MKWTNNAGPRKSKQALALLSAVHRTIGEWVEIYGTEAEPMRSVLSQLFDPNPRNAVGAAEWNTLGEKYAWTLTNENLSAIELDATAALERARAGRPIEDKRRSNSEEQERIAARVASDEEREAKDAEIKAGHAKILAKRPSWAKALIVACEDVDDSDSMSDYHGHHTTRTVAIGWRRSSREDFAAMREAAGAYPPTAHLGPGCDPCTVRVFHPIGRGLPNSYTTYDSSHALNGQRFNTRTEAEAAIQAAGLQLGRPEDTDAQTAQIDAIEIEHREKYSMGHGYYLKASYIDSSGWRVDTVGVSEDGKLQAWEPIEDGLPDSRPVSPAPSNGSGGDRPSMSLNAEKNGVELRFPDKPSEQVMEDMRANGFRVTRRPPWVWYAKQSPEAILFARELATPPDDPRRSVRTPEGQAVLTAHKLRAEADRLQKEIDKRKPYDGMNPTRKRLQAWDQAAKNRAGAERLQRALRTLAAWHESGQWPSWADTALRLNHMSEPVPMVQLYLDPDDGQRPVTTECTRERFNGAVTMLHNVQNGPKKMSVRELLAPWRLYDHLEQTRAVARWLLLTASPEDPVKARQRAIEAAERELLTLNLPGYFPTPPAVARQMVEAAEIRPGMRVLEPSAGSGAIADEVQRYAVGQLHAAVKIECVEISPRLSALLELKGYGGIRADFLDPNIAALLPDRAYDRVLMNPPFENGQDIEHVMHAYKLLASGGRLVALMSPGPWFRNDSKARLFRNWLSALAEVFTEPDTDALDFSAPIGVRDHLINGGFLHWSPLPAGSFKESGTGVEVRMLVIGKPAACPLEFVHAAQSVKGCTCIPDAQDSVQNRPCPDTAKAEIVAPGRSGEAVSAPVTDFGGLEAVWEGN